MKYLTTKDLSEHFQLHPSTIRKWCREEKINAKKLGNQWRIATVEVDKLLELILSSLPPKN